MTKTLPICFSLLFGISGCSGAAFEIEVPLQESRVAGNPLGGLLGNVIEVPIPLDVDVAAETAARDTGPASAVRLLDLRLFITETEEPAGDTDDFAFVEAVDIYVESAAAGSGLPRLEIAQAVAPLAGDRVLLFLTDEEVDLLPYINEGARLTSDGRGTVPPDDVSFAGTAALGIEVF